MTELKSCPYCDGAEHDIGADASDYKDGAVITIGWNADTPYISAAGYCDGGYYCGSTRFDIMFCPFCGRRLVGYADE